MPHPTACRSLGAALALGLLIAAPAAAATPASGFDAAKVEIERFQLPEGARPHDVAPAPDGAAWITDGGQNAIVRVDPATEQVAVYPLPADTGYANLNTAAFDGRGVLWFTGQNGVYGRLEPATGEMDVYTAPRGRGPYGITTTPGGDVYYASLAGDYVGQINLETGAATVLEPPTPNQGARRVWSDSLGQIWVSEWDAGQVARYNPADGQWREWPLPGPDPSAYAVYVDEEDIVWLSDFGGNALVRFDPVSEQFDPFPLESTPSNVRQILGRTGEVWGAESAADRLVVVRTIPDELSGDYNDDGVVNAADYVLFRNNQGTMNVLANDPIGGEIGAAHYNQWVDNFGNTLGSGSSGTIPEPTTLLMLLATSLATLVVRRR